MFRIRPMLKNATRAVQSVKYLSCEPKKNIDMTVDHNGIAVMTFQRPPVNSYNLDLLEEMCKLLDESARNQYKGLVLTSALPTIFSAGLDLMEMYKPDKERSEAFYIACQEMWIKLFGAGFVTTAAINGHAPGAGCLVALSCEYRAMVKGEFKMGLNETAVGLTAPPFTIDTMLHVLPVREAELALISGKLYTPAEALKAGMIDAIANSKQDAIEKCKEFIRKFDHISPTARSVSKRTLRQEPIKKLVENRQKDLETFLDYIRSPEVQASLEGYMQRLKVK